MASSGQQQADAQISLIGQLQVEGGETLQQPAAMPVLVEPIQPNWPAAVLIGGNNNPQRVRRENEQVLLAQCEQSNAMLARALKIILAATGYFIATDTGKERLESALQAKDDDIAATPIGTFIFSMVAYVWLALISRIFKFRSTTIDDLSAFLMAMMVVSLAAVFVQDRVPWLIFVPLLFPVLVLLHSVWMLYF